MPDGPPYTAGDVLTCSSDGYPATYDWTVNGSPASSTYTHVLQEGQHVYECTATVTFENGNTCDAAESINVAAHSKY